MTTYILDTETTGQPQPEVIELAYAKFAIADAPARYGEIFSSRYKSEQDILPEARAVHHILDYELADCPPSREAKLPADCDYMVGHAVDYDWLALGSPPVKRICTLALARTYFPGGKHSLAAMMYRLLDQESARRFTRDAHSARADLRSCAILFDAISAAVSPEKFSDWEAIWRLSELAREPRLWHFGKYREQPIEDAPQRYMQWALENVTDLDPYLGRKLRRLLGLLV